MIIMRKFLFTILATIGLLATFGLAPAAAATGTPVLKVSYSTFQNVTNTPSHCAVVVPDVSYKIPVPASILDEVANVSRYGYHSLGGWGYINTGAYPGNVLIANHTVTKFVYIPYLNTTTRVNVLPHQYDAFVPGYAGRTCSQWVHLVAQD